ncbi:ubiquitin-conjugating enzyme E2-binding protein [Rhypophila decipiens]|uniref:Ubiquitin-conjugating enzyme E2-binding protein n=1 Tax=Rhypophila decipiens TaxID=261697 RepID=A0AAN6Y5P5_9PEZI|nr:ubiquitin-conjugating enzyme E2-binding protein [Rhypophila decipiens]
MASEQSILYAELLPNIGRISLAISLSPPAVDASTRVAIDADGSNVELRHYGEIHRLRLPSRVALGGSVLPIQKQGVGTLSWPLPLHSTQSLQSRQPNIAGLGTSTWSATDLKIGSGVSCRKCGSVIVKDGSIVAWKDLPSENWAEMMEFWHCHKPDHPHGSHSHDSASNASRGAETSLKTLENGDGEKADDASLAARGYGASSAISAQEGVGFVDLTTLIFAESDCAGITFSLSTYGHGSSKKQDILKPDSSEVKSLNVFCSSCQTQVGFYNFRTTAVTLLKWQVLLESQSGAKPGVSQSLSATLLATKARSGSSKSLIIPMPETIVDPTDKPSPDTVIHVWVFNPNIVYSSSAAPEADAQGTPAIKLLYKLIPCEESEQMLETITCDAQEINLPSAAVAEVIRLLTESNLLLPAPERAFKEWKVALLSK